jgi:glyoxylase-like metal-dependent hydrolase (beta-lactamase superfamily II)
MTSFARRDFLKLLGAAGAATAGVSLLPGLAPLRSAAAQNAGLIGKVFITKSGPVTVHSYMAPDASARVTSHIIETANSLVLVDTQLVQTFARELNTYLQTLGKPLERIILSHEHPDHWAGASNFDGPFVSTATIAQNVEASIPATLERLTAMLGESEIPADPRVPEGTLEAGEETIDGVAFAYDIYNDAEAPEQLVIKLPEGGIAIAQDLLYHDVHTFPLGNIPGWLPVLEGLRGLAADGYEILLPGHGSPAGFGAIDQQVSYLNFLAETIEDADSAEAAVATLTERYPSYGAAGILTFVSFLFASES